MIFVLVLIVVAVVVFIGFYMLSFSFLGGGFVNYYSDVFQSQYMVSENFKLMNSYKNYFLSNGSGYNDFTGNMVDDNKNDDNNYCNKNIGNFKDDDCLYRSLYGFIPPKKQIDLGYFQGVYGSGLEVFLSGNLNNDIVIYLNYLNERNGKSYVFQKTGTIEKNFYEDDLNIKITNKNNNWINYFIKLKEGEGLKNITYDKKNYKYNVSENYNYFFGSNKIMNSDLPIQKTYKKRPINPFSGNIITGDFDSGDTDCSSTGINDISFSWQWTGSKSYTGSMHFEILSGTNKNLTGTSLTGSLSSYCDKDLNCKWIGKNYDNDTYYFKVNTYMCIDSGCDSTIENINGSYIYSGVVDTCNN